MWFCQEYAMSKKMKEMIADFETRIGMELYTESQYEAERATDFD